MHPVLVYVTAPDRQAATQMAESLLTARLVACANMLPGATSLYWWEGAIAQAEEVVLIAKTTADLSAEVIAHLSAAHPYTCPCIITLPIQGGAEPFLRWLREETRPPHPTQATD